MADLFQTTKQNISLHVRNIYEEGELSPESTVKESLTVQTEGGRSVHSDQLLKKCQMSSGKLIEGQKGQAVSGQLRKMQIPFTQFEFF